MCMFPFSFKAKENLDRCGDVFFDIVISNKHSSLGFGHVLKPFRNFNRSLIGRQMFPAKTLTRECMQLYV